MIIVIAIILIFANILLEDAFWIRMIIIVAIILIIADIITASEAPSPTEQRVRMLNKKEGEGLLNIFQIFK